MLETNPEAIVTESPSARERSAWARFARPGISKKFLLLFAMLALIGLANWVVVQSALSRLNGAATLVNVTGSLRWLSQRIQVDTLRIVHGDGGERSGVEAQLGALDESIRVLQQGGTVRGLEVRPLPESLFPAIENIRRAILDYRYDTIDVLDKHGQHREFGEELARMHLDGVALLDAADEIVARLAAETAAVENEAMRNLNRLALLDLTIFLSALLAIRVQIVSPLRRLAVVSRQFAHGRLDRRSGIESKDEIGQLARAFDHMAGQIEQDMRQISIDVEELRKAELSLRKLSQAVEHSPASVVITAPNANIEYVNPKFMEITGYAREEVIGRKPALLSSGQTRPEVYRELWQTILSGLEWRGELLNRKKNGERFWEDTRISPLKDEEGRITHFISVKEDITERKRAEDEIRRLNADLELRVEERTRQLTATNKELEAFSYSVSHDLRGPLRGINGFAHLMEESCRGCEKTDAGEYLARIRRASTRMGDLIDDLLNLARVTRSTLNRAPVDLSEMAGSILADLAAAEPGRHVQTEVQAGITVSGDPSLLRDALANLLGNAWKFTARRNDASIVFGSRIEEGESVIFVADNGAGFDMKYANKLFGAFQRLHGPHDFEGTGIGLATVQRIIHLHGGRIWAAAKTGKGATFNFVVPEHPGG